MKHGRRTQNNAREYHMKLHRSLLLGFLCLASGLLVAGSGLVQAQTDDQAGEPVSEEGSDGQDDFTLQESTGGWGLTQPNPAEAAEATLAVPPADNQPIMVGQQQFGWQIPPQVPADDLPLGELDKLSVSPSGVRFGGQLYNAQSDNPLEPISVTIRALDKITAQYTDLIIEINQSSDFGLLSITPRTCDKRPPQEFPEVTAFLEIVSAELEETSSDEVADLPAVETVESTVGDQPVRDDLPDDMLFSGWMFASSPALNALQHPVYDVWVIDCKMVDPSL